MRVIAGKARRLQLKAPEGMDTRPTTDRIKETLFNMIRDEIEGVCFLDLFSGSGGIGIEALSRGAAFSCFVEQNRKTADIIRENLSFTHLEEQALVMNCSVEAALQTLRQNEQRFHVVYMDPPYRKGLEKKVLAHPDFDRILQEGALVIIEADLQTKLEEKEISGFRLLKEKLYKTNKHIFLEKAVK